MAYSTTKYQLTNLLQDAWYRLGQMRRWTVTGGGTSSVVNSAWAGIDEAIYEDDDPALIYGTAVVIETTDNLAPEGEMGRITDYDSSGNTLTIDALTTAVGSGDKVGIASPLFPLEDMIEAANLGLQKLGEIDIPDESLTISAGQTMYTLPAAIRKRPVQVNVQTNQDSGDYQWVPVQGWDVIPATAGSDWTLVVPLLDSGYKLQVIYRAVHPKLTDYDSPILDGIHPEVALCATVAEALQWYNNLVGGTNQYFLQRENKSIHDLEAALAKFPIQREVEQWQGLPHWGKRGDYVPGTSDLKGYYG